MNLYKTAVLTLFCLALAAAVSAQDKHVHSEYLPDAKMTKVDTDMMFVINTPEQFLQLGLLARYPKQQLVSPPKTVSLTIFSNSPKLLYENVKDQNLLVVTDGESWKAGELKYWSGQGEKTKDGREMFVSPKRQGIGLSNPLPPNARVLEGRDLEHLQMEWLLGDFKFEQFAKIAKAKKVEFQFGKTRIQLTEDQMNTIRAFAALITP